MNYVPVVVAGTSSTNFSGTKDAASQDVKKDVSSLRYIALPNCRNSNPTATLKNPPSDQIETLTVESAIPTVSSHVPTACLDDSPEPSSDTRLISKRVTSQDDTPSLDNILTLSNRFEDILRVTTNTGDTNGVKADLGNMEYNISASPTPTLRIYKDHQKEEPKKISDTLKDPSYVEAMQEELLQFKIQNVWILIDCPKREEGIDYKEVFAPVLRIEAIRLFLAYASFMRFTVYQMDVKSAFLYSTIDEEVYMMQPLGFQDPEFLDKVFKVEKSMYGLHQDPRAWYGTLSKYLLANGFQRGTIDQTLFIRKHKGDFLLVQVYVGDIIFGSSNRQLCREFEALMHDKFQMSAMGELNFFFGLQVLQKKDGIFLSQDKYAGDILKKFAYSDVRSANTPMDKENPWGKDGPGKNVELHLYRSMIGSLMYLTASRPGIMFAVCACVRHQVTPKECHMHDVKRIFRYLKGHPKLGLWYPKESPFDLVAYSDNDYGGATQDKKSTTEGCQFLGRRLISWQCKKQKIVATSTIEAEYVAAASGYGQFWSTARIETTNEGTKSRTISESSIRRNLKLNDEEGISSLPDAELFKNLVLMGYNILPNQKFTFQKGFNEFSSNIATAMGEGSRTPTEPHHTPSPEAQQSPYNSPSSHLHPPATTETIPFTTPTEIPTLRQYSRRAKRIAQSIALFTAADKHASFKR
nr:putative ribonuclease H-like domain-containing protein [Tanacetum cinerariifolium]